MKKIFSLIIIAAMAASAAYAQNSEIKEFRQTLKMRKMEAKMTASQLDQKASKLAKKEAKTLTKEGWVVPAGVLPLEKQLDKSYNMAYEFDESMLPKYIFGEARSFGQTYDAAKMQAVTNAKVELAGMLQTEVTALTESTVANSQIAPEDAVSINEAVQATKSLIAQKLGRVFISTECFRKTKKGYEVNIRIAYNAKMAIDYAKQVIKAELEAKGKDLHNELDAMWGNLEK